MSTDFEWQTDLQDEWSPEPPPQDPPRPRSRTRWRWWLLMLSLALSVLPLGVWRVQQQVQAAEAAVQEDVLATHRLVMTAVTEGDEELFASLLDRQTKESWVEVQEELFREGLLLDRRPFDLYQSGPPGRAMTVTVAPDLQMAQVYFPVSYTVRVEGGMTETVQLEQMFAYRLIAGRWLLSPLLDDYWGETVREQRQDLFIVYQDQELDAPIADYLLNLWEAFCNYTGECPIDIWMGIGLSNTDSYEPHAYMYHRQERDVLSFQTVLLVGRPVDEAAFQALARGYGRRAMRFIQSQYDTPVYEDDAYSTAVSRRLLAELELLPWPAAPATEASPAPLNDPDQDVAMICTQGVNQGSRVRRFDPTTGRWTTALEGSTFTNLFPLPQDDGLFLSTFAEVGTTTQVELSLWRPGQPLVSWRGNYHVIFDRQGPGGVLYHLDRWASWFGYRMDDLADCTTAVCPSRLITDTYAVWSPDGRQRIFRDQEGEVFRQTAEGTAVRLAVAAENVARSFWVDNDTYGLVTLAADGESYAGRVWLAAAEDDEFQLLATTEQMAEAVGDRIDFVQDVQPHPLQDGRFLALAFRDIGPPSAENSTAYLFELQTEGDPAVTLLATFSGQTVSDLTFSSNGRWLTLVTYDPEGWSGMIHLFDLQANMNRPPIPFEHGRSYRLPSYDWSADGNWLAVADEGLLRLFAPAHDYEQLVVPDEAGCVYAAWLDKE